MSPNHWRRRHYLGASGSGRAYCYLGNSLNSWSADSVSWSTGFFAGAASYTNPSPGSNDPSIGYVSAYDTGRMDPAGAVGTLKVTGTTWYGHGDVVHIGLGVYNAEAFHDAGSATMQLEAGVVVDDAAGGSFKLAATAYNLANGGDPVSSYVDPVPSLPWWLVCRIAADLSTVTSEVWLTDPALGGSPTRTITF